MQEDQNLERTGPQRIRRDSTLAVMRTKVHATIGLAAIFGIIGLVCLLKTLLDEQPHDQMMLYLAALACLLAATICGAAGASFSGALAGAILTSKLISETTKAAHDLRSLKRHIEDLDGRARANNTLVQERLTKLERKEGLVLEGVSTIQNKIGDDLGKRRQVARQKDPNTSMS